MSSLIAAEGGYQDFILQGGEWAVLILSAVAAVVAIIVGLLLAKNVMAQDEGTPKMKEIAKAIQEGASAYLRRQFKTIAVILFLKAVFLNDGIKKPDGSGHSASPRRVPGRTVALSGCLVWRHWPHRYDRLHVGNVRTAAAAKTG